MDTSAAGSSAEGLMWLRLVQSARDRDEQNLEAYVKNGQLFYRSLRRIEKDEELLVWYGKDLIELLLLGSSRNHVKSKGIVQKECVSIYYFIYLLDNRLIFNNIHMLMNRCIWVTDPTLLYYKDA